jgi:hypothetical protein
MKSPESPTLKVPENKPSQIERKDVIEIAQQERFALAIDVLKRLTSHALDLTPIGNLKMGAEIAAGKTLSGEELKLADKAMYSLIIASSLTFWGLLTLGISNKDPEALRLAGMAWTATTGLTVTQKGVQIIKEAQKLAKKYNMESLHQLLVTAEEAIKKLKENGNGKK